MSHETVVGTGKPRDAIAANAVHNELGAGVWSQAFDLDRTYVESLDKTDLKRLSLFVQANGTTSEKITRRHYKETHNVAIVMRKNVDPANTIAVDALSRFVEEVADYFRGHDLKLNLTGTNTYVMEAVSIPPNPDKLATDREFFAGVALSVVEIVT